MMVSKTACAGLIGIAGLVAAAPAGGPLTALARIDQGQWQIKTVGVDTPPRSACLTDMSVLIQYGHGSGAQCRRSIVVNSYDMATVHYMCPGMGHGQTSVRVATPSSFNLDTQGILGGAPFDESYEAKRLGPCETASAH
jgi:hypothetical protein